MIWEVYADMRAISDSIRSGGITYSVISVAIEQCYKKKYNMSIKPINMRKFIVDEFLVNAKSRFFNEHEEACIKYNDVSNSIYMTYEIIRDYDLGCL